MASDMAWGQEILLTPSKTLEAYMKLYSIREFAREKGVSLSTVQKWIREGKIKGLIKNDRSYLIPESNLSIQPARWTKRKRVVIVTEKQAREAYSELKDDKRNRLKFSYDELKERFDSGMTIETIAGEAGVSKQRISQVYDRYFVFGVDGHRRRSAIRLEMARERELQEAMDSERILHLKKVIAVMGFSVKPVHLSKGPSFHKNVVEINGHLCKIHLSRKDTKFAGTRYRAYSRFLVTRRFLDDYEFVIVITGEGETRKFFIIPSQDLKLQFRKNDKRRKSFYLPTSEQGAYRNIYPLLDWWSYEGAWHLLRDGSSD